MKSIKQTISIVAKNNTPLSQLARVYRFWTSQGHEVTITPKVKHG